ncbi:hypothetical protein B0A48_12178 [Cryoendolithus antarcticus]|uniref:VWFA domain-containing protein n=1 Tax=Cryoendolithus antarcticus TaxID=1507870 RepID=A0A1V8SUA3_9PEZI|nr:hypothetical protein B0A48_12178 [Cryoendolithus antarcticus]
MRVFTIKTCVSLIVLFALQQTRGLIPTVGYSVYGFLGTSHTSITKRAIEALDLQYFPVKTLTNSMRRARDEIAAANAQVDETDAHNAPSHFDGEGFPAGQDRLSALRLETKFGLAAGDATRGRRALGQALHTLQDFYSHSNWIESGRKDINRDVLGLDSSTAIARPDPSTTTCQNCTTSLEEKADLRSREFDIGCQQACKSPTDSHVTPLLCVLLAGCDTQDCANNLFTSGALTSGYYSEEGPEYTKPGDHKCSHGGIFDGSAQGIEGINKDSVIYTLSPHAYLHKDAVVVALEATKEYIRSIHDDSDVTPEQFRLLMGAGPMLAFAIDTTGSMSSIIEGVRTEARSIVRAKLGTIDEPILYVVSQIQDPGTHYIATYTSGAEFDTAINNLGAGGGDDCPELAMSAIINALNALSEGGTLFVYTDAAAKDIDLASEAAELARQKRVQVFSILFANGCTSSEGFDLLAAASGGEVLQLGSSSEQELLPASDVALRRRQEMNATTLIKVPVDSSMTQLIFSLSSITAGLLITHPNGTLVNDTDPSVTRTDLTGAQFYIITSPEPGIWTVGLTGTSSLGFSLTISGVSSLALTSFDYVELRGRPGHEGYFPVSIPPAPGSSATVLAEIDGAFADATFQYRTLGGELIANMSLTNGGGNVDDPVEGSVFYGNVTVPTGNYTVYVVGHDGTGREFQRVLGATFLVPGGNVTQQYLVDCVVFEHYEQLDLVVDFLELHGIVLELDHKHYDIVRDLYDHSTTLEDDVETLSSYSFARLGCLGSPGRR